MSHAKKPPRPGEVLLDFDPGDSGGPALEFIGKIRSPWGPDDCPKNIGQARETGQPGRIELNPGYAPGLLGLEVGQAIVLLYWMDGARRDLIVQNPCHASGPRGTFALRSPARPNTISLATVRITSIDSDAGVVGIDAIDCFDGTPLVDIKPWLSRVDVPPDADL